MSKSHNKKRNVALLYEFLVRTISSALVEGDQRSSSQALKIVKRHFKPGTELYKEFRLVNSLIKTTVSSEAVAASIMQEAKNAARSHDVKELDRQKSLLIRSINHTIKDENFYDQQVNEYRILATIQTLINDWRDPNRDLERLARYEDQLVKWLVSEKIEPVDGLMPDDSPGTSRLLMKVMMKKLNEKYSGVLNDEQKSLIRAYAFSTANDDPESIQKKLTEIKERLVQALDVELSERFDENASKTETYTVDKLVEARTRLLAEDLSTIDDDVVTRFMLYTKLGSELETE